MALAAQALEAQKARKPLEQGGALEQVAARIERVMGLTNKVSGWPWASPIDCRVRCDALLTGMTPLLAKSRTKKRPDLKQRKTY